MGTNFDVYVLLGFLDTYPRLGMSLISSFYLYGISSPNKLGIYDAIGEDKR
jgi:hypothetical protein